MSLSIGKQKITADGVIGTSGKNIRLFGLIVRASSGGATVVNIYEGTSAGGTLVDVVNGATSTTERPMYAGGLLCSGGLYIDVDANTSFVTAIYEQENS